MQEDINLNLILTTSIFYFPPLYPEKIKKDGAAHHLKMQLGHSERWEPPYKHSSKIGAFRPSTHAAKGQPLPGEKIILPIWAENTCIPISGARPSPKPSIAALIQQKSAGYPRACLLSVRHVVNLSSLAIVGDDFTTAARRRL